MSLYWLLYAFAWIAGGAYLIWEARQRRLPLTVAIDAVILSAPLSLLFGHLVFAVLDGPVQNLSGFLFTWRGWSGGYTSFGGVLGVMIAVPLVARIHQIDFPVAADLIAPALYIGSFFGRLGCFFQGCCYGRATNHSWAVRFSPALTPGQTTAPCHPTQLYEAALSLVAFALALQWLLRRPTMRAGNGVMALCCLAGYFIIRFVVEFFRAGGSAAASVGGLTTAQVISGPSAVLCIAWAIRRARCRPAGASMLPE